MKDILKFMKTDYTKHPLKFQISERSFCPSLKIKELISMIQYPPKSKTKPRICSWYKFMQMETLTPALLNELVEKIEVYSIEGKGKNRTQRTIIHYRFFGVIENTVKEKNVVLEARQGVAVEYITAKQKRAGKNLLDT